MLSNVIQLLLTLDDFLGHFFCVTELKLMQLLAPSIPGRLSHCEGERRPGGQGRFTSRNI